MKSKAKLYEWIDRFNTNDLSGEEYIQFVHLLNSDLRVREEVLLDRGLNSMLKDKELLDLRKKITNVCKTGGRKEINYNRYVLIAAAVLIILTIGFTVSHLIRIYPHSRNTTSFETTDVSERGTENFLLFPGQQNTEKYSPFGSETPLTERHSGEAKFNRNLMASYEPNKTFEYLTGITWRSSGFSLTLPGSDAKFVCQENITFSWRTGKNVKTSLYINDNLGILRYESEYNSYSSVRIKAGFLGKGLFYYKIVEEDEVVYIGKFTIY